MNKKVLFVEGVDDKHVVMHLCRKNGINAQDYDKRYVCNEFNETLEIDVREGVESLLRTLRVSLKLMEENDVFGFLLDADQCISGRWKAVKQSLLSLGYISIPDEPDQFGTIIQGRDDIPIPRVGFWLMPNNKTPGILEDFLAFMINDRSKLFQHVEASVANIPKEARLFSDTAKSKAIIHTWLAWQETPGKSLGTAITAKYLDPEVPEVTIFMGWIKKLFFYN